MDDLNISNRFSLVTLEYDFVVERLAGSTQSSLGRELAEKIQPGWNREDIELRLDYTDDARRFFDHERALPSFQGLNDVRSQVARAGKGGFLSAPELWKINAAIKSIRSVRHVLREAQWEYIQITREAQRLGLFPEIEDALDHAIHPDGDVLDRASSELQRIRHDLSRERERAEHTLSNMINTYAGKGYLREANYTFKNGRYVLPFRQDCQKNVKAIVQARSSAGATVFLEPYELVERNNRLSELKGEEETEVARILAQLSALVGAHADELRSSINTVAFLDYVFACGRLSREWRGSRVRFSDSVRIKKARHPKIPHDVVVPVDIEFPGVSRALIISGPNAGGKTVALKTIGLFALISQSGLHIPAWDDSELPVFGSIHADIGDQQSIEWNLSSFSAHIELVKRMFKSLATDGHLPAMVLLDEIGRSTDPQEGSALSLAIIEKLLETDCYSAITTHLPAIKNMVLSDDARVAGASVEFDIERAMPKYTISTGSLGASYAIAIARRLGLNEDVLLRAEDLLTVKGDDLLSVDIPSLKQHIEKLQDEVTRSNVAKDNAVRDLHTIIALEKLMMLSALDKAEKITHKAEVKLEEARKIASNLPHKLDREKIIDELKDIRAYGDRLRKAANLLSAPGSGYIIPEKSGDGPEVEPQGFVVGQQVWVISLRREAELIELDKDRAIVVIGGKRLKVGKDQLKPMEAEEVSKKTIKRPETPGFKSLSLFVDVHGLTVEEAIEHLDPYLDEAFYQGRERAHIIHGFGTGRLRMGIHDFLKGNPRVQSFETAEAEQGGAGVTVVTLKKGDKG
ncbi:MAG: Smr/MutS family protein [bacterium]|nr:Smr/MutS family protein [bacterium]